MVIAYRGTNFRGLAPNHGVTTVMGELAGAIEKVIRHPVNYSMSGRTDAGVHAWGQVISLDLPTDIDRDALARRLNKMCAPDISVRSISWADPDFDARFSATSRTYRYQVWNEIAPHPLLADQVWHITAPLNLEVMNRAAQDLIGEHDFTSFCRRPKVDDDHPLPSMVRIMYRASWTRIDDSPLVRFEISGSAFCHQQVRSCVGTLVDIGRGRLAPDSILTILAAHDRAAAGPVAPPTGLILWNVGYDGVRWDAAHVGEASDRANSG
ncbi:MAG: tRNA pseudouridine(38-40) synthase TruA [Ilumatobacter coccineus]|uniref:tRNA pseudouridine synthase A n=1 Tax=Ilumatobacter coccineus TaxID=467094 RepID=A0A2G6K726_9ACTN|nr:MAG: tRNA pseudouridine(38-40) synthase TruA [Ilumatobacter coccineus]